VGNRYFPQSFAAVKANEQITVEVWDCASFPEYISLAIYDQTVWNEENAEFPIQDPRAYDPSSAISSDDLGTRMRLTSVSRSAFNFRLKSACQATKIIL